eukprot:CAMPEP_0180379270 /NCGR_PEP_ID=MMETSP0989-20121125/25240_1 /TAXON_ID=697907 /ORGANISM="non described non described, Strain CCMP2293" /LENGTH=87 /DNA_ID=CAMNT_0022378303 /DNA_START=132 /DNA_END=392 /DNA_ORIENTATION=+
MYGGGGDNRPLPPGWQSASDPTSGRTYWYNTGTQQTQWEFPSGAPAGPPASAPSASQNGGGGGYGGASASSGYGASSGGGGGYGGSS